MPIVAYENTGGQVRFPFFLYWKHTERNAYLIEQQTVNFAQTVFVKLYLFEYVVRGGGIMKLMNHRKHVNQSILAYASCICAYRACACNCSSNCSCGGSSDAYAKTNNSASNTNYTNDRHTGRYSESVQLD